MPGFAGSGWPQGVFNYSDEPSWGGTPSRSGAGAYGAVPQLPSYTKDIQTSVGPDVYAQLTKNLPGYQSMVGASSGNIQNNLAGRVSSDVIAQLQQGGAERGIATGTEGSGANNAAYLRALGLTSMQLQQLGESQLTAAVGRTPIQQTQTGNQFSDLAAQQAIYNAAPNPTMAAGASIAAARAGMGAGWGGGPQAPSSGLAAMGYQNPSMGSGGGNYTAMDLSSFQQPGYNFDPMSGQYTPTPWDPTSFHGSAPQGQGTPYSGSVAGYNNMLDEQSAFPEWDFSRQGYSQYNYGPNNMNPPGTTNLGGYLLTDEEPI